MADIAVPLTDAVRRAVPAIALLTALATMASDPAQPRQNALALLAVLPFCLWAWRPDRVPLLLMVSLVAVAEVLALRSGALEALLFLGSLSAVVLGTWESSPSSLVVGALIAVSAPVAAELLAHDGIYYGVWIMGTLLPLMLGRVSRWQVQTATELAEARQELARQAVLDTQRRIARDVHDLVGHGLAAMLLHVTGARHVLRRDPDEADAALAEAESVGRRSLGELRRTLQILREPPTPTPGAATPGDVDGSAFELGRLDAPDGAAPDPGPSAARDASDPGSSAPGSPRILDSATSVVGPSAAPDARRASAAKEDRGTWPSPAEPPDALHLVAEPPVPDATAISDAVVAARASGLDVELRVEGDLELIDPITGLSLHRVVEEALANARRHAPRAVTDVVLSVADDTVVLAIDSIGPLGPDPSAPPPADGDGPRYGLIGMRERMTAVGGQFEAGPTATGWLIRCQAPLTSAADG